jgi:molybdopterin molybdotransferase
MAKAIEIEAARQEILARVRRTAVEPVGLGDALGRRLAADAVADGPSQPFDNSSMDGFAVRAADLAAAAEATPVALELIDESRAGHPASRPLGSGQAIAISTGAVLPAGADAVVPVEDSEQGDGRVLIKVSPAPAAYVRRAGEDIAAGTTVLAAGTELGPAELGALATIGLDPAPVHRRPRVAVLTSGDELTPAHEPLGPGRIRDSNAQTVPALARLAGAEVASVTWIPDDPALTRAALAAALDADVGDTAAAPGIERPHLDGRRRLPRPDSHRDRDRARRLDGRGRAPRPG